MNHYGQLGLRGTLLGLLFLPCWGVPAAAQILVPKGSTWSYDDTGTDLMSAWSDPLYDDGGWSDGPAPLGYGEAYIATPVSFGADPADKNPTTYFRIHFTLTEEPADITRLQLLANYDDGFVAYINGQEAARGTMPAGPITYDTYASGLHEGGGCDPFDIGSSIGELVLGDNVLAVEAHQRNGTSSDLVADYELSYSMQSAIVTRGPYLQVATDTSIVLRWRTDASVDGRVRYGTEIESMFLFEETTATTEHEIRVGGLLPATKYFYSIGTSTEVFAGNDSAHCFVTHPPIGTVKPTRVWLIGDSGQANQGARDVRDAYLGYTGTTPTDLWIMLGDNAYNTGTDSEYQAAVFDIYGELLRTSALWPTRGNHDSVFQGPNNDYYDIFTMPTAGEAGGLASGTEAYYSYDYADIHFICLDSEGSDLTVGSAMFTWLADDLAATNQDWIIAYWHHPPYTKGSHDSDNANDSGGRMRDMRLNALPILEAGGVDLVFSGHSHSYERSFLLDGHYGISTTLQDSNRVDDGDGSVRGGGAYVKPSPYPAPNEGAVFTTAGSSSKIGGGPLNHPVMVTSLNVLGSVVLDIDGNQLDAVFLDDNGTVKDDYRIIKAPVGLAADASSGELGAIDNRPNPFAGRTRFTYSLPRAGRVRLAIHDVQGRQIATLEDGDRAAGEHAAVWDGRGANGRAVAGGVYFSRLEFEGDVRTKKLIVVR